MGPENWSEMAGPPGTTVKLCMREPSPAPGPPSSSLHPHSALLQARLSLDHAVPGPASSQGLSPLVPDLPHGPPCHPGPLPPAFPSLSTPFLPFPKHTLSVSVSYIPLLPPYLPPGPDKCYPGPPSQNSLTTPGLHLPRKLTVPHTALQMTKHSESGMHLLLALQNPLPTPSFAVQWALCTLDLCQPPALAPGNANHHVSLWGHAAPPTFQSKSDGNQPSSPPGSGP